MWVEIVCASEAVFLSTTQFFLRGSAPGSTSLKSERIHVKAWQWSIELSWSWWLFSSEKNECRGEYVNKDFIRWRSSRSSASLERRNLVVQLGWATTSPDLDQAGIAIVDAYAERVADGSLPWCKCVCSSFFLFLPIFLITRFRSKPDSLREGGGGHAAPVRAGFSSSITTVCLFVLEHATTQDKASARGLALWLHVNKKW